MAWPVTDAATWDAIHAEAAAEKSPLVRSSLYALLARADDKALAQKALDLSLTSEPGETVSARIIRGVAHEHPELAFRFAVAHRDAVNSKVDNASQTQFIPELAAGSRNLAMVDELRAYAEAHLPKGARRAADESIAAIQYRARVIAEQLPQITKWLAKP